MSKFIIQQSDTPNHWVCTDTDNGIVCVFEQGKFNDTQKFTTLDNFNPNAYMQLARLCREMGDWLRDNHYNKIF